MLSPAGYIHFPHDYTFPVGNLPALYTLLFMAQAICIRFTIELPRCQVLPVHFLPVLGTSAHHCQVQSRLLVSLVPDLEQTRTRSRPQAGRYYKGHWCKF